MSKGRSTKSIDEASSGLGFLLLFDGSNSSIDRFVPASSWKGLLVVAAVMGETVTGRKGQVVAKEKWGPQISVVWETTCAPLHNR